MAMNRRLSKKQKWFKEIVLTEEDELYVGLDVHKTPRQSAPDSKSDRLDSRQLAEYDGNGNLSRKYIYCAGWNVSACEVSGRADRPCRS